MRHRFFLPILLLALHASHSRAAAVGGETWSTLPTGHFRVHFTAGYELFAREFARHLERALPALEKDLGWRPATPIDVVVNDRSDFPNALAVSFPNTHIEVWPVPFPVDTSLGDYTDWIEELAIHELTHIVANDTARGAWGGLRSVFGSVIKPNGLQPAWLIEGLAVYFETRFTHGGRGRSPLTEALLRSAIRNRLFDHPDYLTLDRLNEGPFWWPDGHTPYLVGYSLQASLAKASDAQPFPGSFSQKNAARFPWTPNTLLDEMKGIDWSQAWKDLGEKLKSRFPGEASPSTCRVTTAGAHTGGHSASLDGWVYFTYSHPSRGHWLARVPSSGCAPDKLELLVERERPGTPLVAASSDGSLVAYTDSDLHRSERLFHDLWIWNRETRSTERLTHGLRAFDPAFLPGKHELVFVRNQGGVTQSLERMVIGSKPETLFTAAPFERLSHPAAFGNTVFFTRHFNNGREEVWSFDLTTRKAAQVPALSGTRQRHPVPQSDNSLLYAAWDRASNTWSIWKRASNGQSSLVLRSESGYLGRAIPAGTGYLVTDYYPEGFDLRWMSQSDAATTPPTDDLHKSLSGESPQLLADRGLPADLVTPYSAHETAATSIWPQYWLPLITSTLDGTLLGATTSGNDPLRYHYWGASLQYDTRAPFPTWNAFYANRSTGNTLRVSSRQWNNWFSSTRESNREELHVVDLTIPWNHWAFAFGTGLEGHSLSGRRVESGFIFHSTRFSNEWNTPEAMAPNKGGAASITLMAHPASRYESSFFETQPSAAIHMEGFRPSHSASLETHGGFSTNRLLASNYFQGGGPSAVSPSPWIVRGYPVDALLGQRILTVNSSYVFPVKRLWRGSGVAPWFVKQAGIRLAADAGTATWTATFDANQNFRGYSGHGFGKRVLTGAGADFLLTGTVFHHVPVRLVLGVHQGFQRREGGDTRFYLGFESGEVLP